MPKPATPRKFRRLTSEQRRADLIRAGLACMARGGMQEFTVDRICAEAGVSRGLIRHHFGSMSGLLTAVYDAMYDAPARLLWPRRPGQLRLHHLIETFFAPEVFNREVLNIWLTLWGQASIDAELRAEHRVKFAAYLAEIAVAIAETAAANDREVAVDGLARGLVCLVDGLGLQHCVDPASMPPELARSIVRALLEPQIGPITGGARA